MTSEPLPAVLPEACPDSVYDDAIRSVDLVAEEFGMEVGLARKGKFEIFGQDHPTGGKAPLFYFYALVALVEIKNILEENRRNADERKRSPGQLINEYDPDISPIFNALPPELKGGMAKGIGYALERLKILVSHAGAPPEELGVVSVFRSHILGLLEKQSVPRLTIAQPHQRQEVLRQVQKAERFMLIIRQGRAVIDTQMGTRLGLLKWFEMVYAPMEAGDESSES